MNREIIAASRIVAFQELKRNWIAHEERVKKIKPTLKTRSIMAKSSSAGNGKLKMNPAQILQIQMENRALLKKLTERSKLKQQFSNNGSLSKSTRREYYQKYKLNLQNQGLYRRLKDVKPSISAQRHYLQRKQTEKYINTICKYGYKGHKPNKTIIKFEMENDERKYFEKKQMTASRLEEHKNDIESSVLREKDNRSHKTQDEVSVRSTTKRDQNLSSNSFYKQKNKNKSKRIPSRQLMIDSRRVYMRGKLTATHLHLQIVESNSVDKQNRNSQGEEKDSCFQLLLDTQIFQEKYQGDVEKVVKQIHYDNYRKGYVIG